MRRITYARLNTEKREVELLSLLTRYELYEALGEAYPNYIGKRKLEGQSYAIYLADRWAYHSARARRLGGIRLAGFDYPVSGHILICREDEGYDTDVNVDDVELGTWVEEWIDATSIQRTIEREISVLPSSSLRHGGRRKPIVRATENLPISEILTVMHEIEQIAREEPSFRFQGEVTIDEIDEVFRAHGVEVRRKVSDVSLSGTSEFTADQAALLGQQITAAAFPHPWRRLPNRLPVKSILQKAAETIGQR